MADQAAQGKKLLADGQFTEAVEQFSLALKSSPTSPDYLIQRSTAYHKAKEYTQALKDAEAAVVYATKRAKRELIAQAQLRRGIALFALERYGDAKFAFDIVKKLDEKDKSVGIWLHKVNGKLAAEPTDEAKTVVTIKELPEIEEQEVETVEEVKPVSKPAANQPTPADKIRHDWYQSSASVSFTLLARGVPKDKATVDIQATSLSISFPVEGTSSTYDFTADPLFAPVDVAKSTYKILPTKLEVTLVKATPGTKWSALEGTEAPASAGATSSEDTPSSTAIHTTIAKAPGYPTSARGGPKNWDKIATEETTTKDGLEDFEGGDDATKFFKQLYKGANPETQRAMMKSYVESNGTALSTDWKEVSKKTVETLPPDGMVAKKWSS